MLQHVVMYNGVYSRDRVSKHQP